MKEIGVGLIGHQFMGKAHSNAWLKAARFFDLPAKPVMKVICGIGAKEVQAMAERWGWQSWTENYREVMDRDDVQIVDICTPNYLHKEMVLAAAAKGKHIVCEKPLGMNAAECKEMWKAAEKARVKHMVSHCYRRCPAVMLAKDLIDSGAIGRIFHIRAVYLQDWIIDPKFPLVWRLKKEVSGSGAHGDLNAHIIDLARFLVGEFSEVCGMTETFIKERPIEVSGGGLAAGTKGKGMGKVTVDDAALFLARFANGAIGSFEATRFAQGRKNCERFEINGEKGSLAFDFEEMNVLWYFDATRPRNVQGFTRILATDPSHSYFKNYWPGGHIIGYEHQFIAGAADFVTAVVENKKAWPDFEDGYRNQVVLDAVLESASRKSWVKIPR